jgi:hypothetical protein
MSFFAYKGNDNLSILELKNKILSLENKVNMKLDANNFVTVDNHQDAKQETSNKISNINSDLSSLVVANEQDYDFDNSIFLNNNKDLRIYFTKNKYNDINTTSFTNLTPFLEFDKKFYGNIRLGACELDNTTGHFKINTQVYISGQPHIRASNEFGLELQLPNWNTTEKKLEENGISILSNINGDTIFNTKINENYTSGYIYATCVSLCPRFRIIHQEIENEKCFIIRGSSSQDIHTTINNSDIILPENTDLRNIKQRLTAIEARLTALEGTS